MVGVLKSFSVVRGCWSVPYWARLPSLLTFPFVLRTRNDYAGISVCLNYCRLGFGRLFCSRIQTISLRPIHDNGKERATVPTPVHSGGIITPYISRKRSFFRPSWQRAAFQSLHARSVPCFSPPSAY